MKENTTQLLKFKKLKRTLRLPEWQAIGLLESLWKCARTNTPEGDIGRLSNEDIAAAIEWEGDADEMIGALVEHGWLDADDDHRLVVHDWSDHVPGYLRGSFKAQGREFVDRKIERGSKTGSKTQSEGTSETGSKAGSIDQVTETTPSLLDSIPLDSILEKEGADEPPIAPRPKPERPTVDDVRAYCRERNNRIDPEQFVDHYTANGWKQSGGNTIKDWRAAVRTWERNGVGGVGGLPPPASSTRLLTPRRARRPDEVA